MTNICYELKSECFLNISVLSCNINPHVLQYNIKVKDTMSWGNGIYSDKGKFVQPHTIEKYDLALQDAGSYFCPSGLSLY